MSLCLYPHQEDALKVSRAGFAAGGRSQIFYAPTGAGKTEIAIAIMDAAAKKQKRCAMVLDRIVLVNQTSERLQKYGIDHGVLMSGHWRYRPYERIQICSAQTLERRGSSAGLDLLIVDEAHQTRAETAHFIKSNKSMKVLGLSATPLTKGLGAIYDHIVSPLTNSWLCENNWLVMPTIYCATEIDMSGAQKDNFGEWKSAEVESRGIKITGDIVAEWKAKTQQHFGGPVKSVVFVATVAQGAELSQKFSEAGFNFVAVSYKDTDEFKADVYKDFAKTDTCIHGLIAVDLLTKGFDVPDILCGVMARPFTKSISSVIQQVGRIMRPAPGKTKCILLDHAGNLTRHKDRILDIFENGIHELDDGAEKSKPEPTEKEKKDGKCPKCSALWIGSSDCCAACGYVRERRNEVQVVPGHLQEFHIAGANREAKQQLYSELLAVADARNYSAGWVGNKFRDEFGVWPKGLSDVRITPSRKTLNSIRAANVAYAKTLKQAATV